MGHGKRPTTKIKTDLKVLNKFERLKNIPHNPVGIKSDYATRKVANTRHLKRLLVWLEEVDYVCYIDIKNMNLMPPYKILDAVKFLASNNLIKKVPKKGHNVYCLPYKEKIVKEFLRLEYKRNTLKSRRKKNANRLD